MVAYVINLSTSQMLSMFARENSQRTFWVLQVMGWSCYAFFVYVAVIRPGLTPENVFASTVHLSIEVLSGVAVTTVMRWVIHRIPRRASTAMSIGVYLFLVLFASIIWNLIKLWGFELANGIQLNSWSDNDFGSWYLFTSATTVGWLAMYWLLRSVRAVAIEKERAHIAESLAKQAQLKTLTSQLNPHFMFNSLNAISTLVLKNENMRALSMIESLSEFLRYSLDGHSDQHLLAEELELLDLYLNIEKVRFGDRFTVELNVDESLLEQQVPSFILQMFAENAMKHAISGMSEGGLLRIGVKAGAETIEMCVEDNGTGFSLSEQPSTGIGIDNVRRRLKALYGAQAQLLIRDSSLGGVKVKITMPKSKGIAN